MSPHRAAAITSAAVVSAAVIAGLYFSGSPSEQRLFRLDERRVADLQRLSGALNAYFMDTGELPADLERLLDGYRLSRLPRDPATDTTYAYAPLGERRFELCAEFSRESAHHSDESFWSHGAGRKCFEFDYTERRGVPLR